MNPSPYDFSPLVNYGLVQENACILAGSEASFSSKVIDSAWQYKNKIVESIVSITDSIFRVDHIEVYPKSLISKEDLFDLCDAYLFGSQSDFLHAYEDAVRIILQHYYRYEVDINMALQQIMEFVSDSIDEVYRVLDAVPFEEELIPEYLKLFEELQSSIQFYYVPHACLSCQTSWKRCCDNSEFLYTYNFHCPFREELGEQRFAKINGLMLSSDKNAALFDNSIRFRQNKQETTGKMSIIEEIYHIVNVDLSQVLESLPTPRNAIEAIRMRNRPEISSFRNILNHWGECLLSGDINTAEQIKKDYGLAREFFNKKERDNLKRRSIFHCFFEVLGNQIPYLSNVVGIITPLYTRKRLLEEEKHRWFLLTR